ncbi:MAG: hypothetical protein ACK5Q5_08685 [Planctomycetaceae bacterium]
MSDVQTTPRTTASARLQPAALDAGLSLADAERLPGRNRKSTGGEETAAAQATRIFDHLRAQLSELDRREQSLNAQLSSLDQEQRLLRMRVREFEEETQDRARVLREGESRVAEREKLLDERLGVLDEQEQEFGRQRAEHEAERANLKQSLAAEIAEDRRRSAIEREQLAAARVAHEEAADIWNREREEQATSLETRRRTVHAELNDREAKISRGEIDLSKRTQFHENHLQRFRQDLEEQRVELERDRQKLRVWKEQLEETLRLRVAHVRRFRDLVEAREDSLARGEQELESARRHADQELLTQQQQLAREVESFERERNRDRNDVRRQQDLLQAHSRALDDRRQKLDLQRDDLELTQRDVLQQQMVLEQARAGFADDAGEEEAGLRLEQSRKALLDFHRQLAASTEERRQELLNTQRQLQERRQAFRDEREAIAFRLTERENEVEQRELRLQVQIVGLHEREHKWQQLREHWRQEKRTAEDVIRNLVLQLESALEACEPPAPTNAGPEDVEFDDEAAAA